MVKDTKDSILSLPDESARNTQKIQYIFHEDNLKLSEPLVLNHLLESSEGMILNIGPQHPSTHGVMRLEVLTDGEQVLEVVPHIGYLHRCFEKHAEKLPFNQIIPYVDRLDYVASMNNELAYVIGIEKMLGIDQQIPPRIQYIRVVVAELNRLASHFVALGTYGVDVGAFTPFLWMMRDREHILRMFEWLSGARLLYNYIWIGGLYYDLPVGFEERVAEFCSYVLPKLKETQKILLENKIFIERTANVGTLPLDLAINYGVSGPMLRASGLRFDLRKVEPYAAYPEIDFEIPIGEGAMGSKGDCWDRTWVRLAECFESLKILEQSSQKLLSDHKRTREFNPQALVPKKIRPQAMDFYSRTENPKGELGFFFRTDGRNDIPVRCKVRSCCFSNLSVLPEISRGVMIADLIAIIGSIDFVMGEVDR